ncbi:MAG: hypothetical protein AUJ32_02435 [Parcubacteria group bacterium CG1_02_40_82]|nr:MAG: hypothetical protein AUJ32_02435 [Parcubacteria group bacterium CG1_02_40_82]
MLFACPVASRRLCYGARPSVQNSFQPREARQSVRSFVQKMFEQSCIIPPISNFPIFARLIRPREARPISSGKFPKVKFWWVG